MGLKYQRSKGSRIKSSRFRGVTTFDGYWWVRKENKWIHNADPNCVGARGSGYFRIRSVRAFRRNLRKWSKYLPKGVKFILISRYKNCDVTGTI